MGLSSTRQWWRSCVVCLSRMLSLYVVCCLCTSWCVYGMVCMVWYGVCLSLNLIVSRFLFVLHACEHQATIDRFQSSYFNESPRCIPHRTESAWHVDMCNEWLNFSFSPSVNCIKWIHIVEHPLVSSFSFFPFLLLLFRLSPDRSSLSLSLSLSLFFDLVFLHQLDSSSAI